MEKGFDCGEVGFEQDGKMKHNNNRGKHQQINRSLWNIKLEDDGINCGYKFVDDRNKPQK